MKLFSLITLCLIIISCDSKRVYEENIDFAKKEWMRDSVYVFHFDVKDTNQDYRLLFNIRNSLNYENYNIYLTYRLEDSLGIISEKMKELYLFDKSTGTPFGSGLGDIFDHRIPILDTIHFSNPGKHSISLQHEMRPDTLKDVLGIGIRLETL